MKKVMIGILILIPVLILLIVAAVSNILSLAAWIAVDDMTLIDKSTHSVAESLTVVFPSDREIHNFRDYVKVEIKPERANRYSIEWRISGEVEFMDEEYKKQYEYYLEHSDDPNLPEVKPPAMLVDERGNETESNTTGKFIISSYCRFNVVVQAESVSKTLAVTVEGYDVKSITVVDVDEDATNEMRVGDVKRVDAKYTPMSSIVTATEWKSDNESVATVDANGVITAVGIGTAKITVKANKHTDTSEFVESDEDDYIVSVVSNGVSKFGSKIVTANRHIALADIGLSESDIRLTTDCTVSGGYIDVHSGDASVETETGILKIEICESGDIAIANADIFNAANGYVFAVSELRLKLNAVWADVFEDGVPTGVEWSSSDETKATVEDGVVKAVSSGLVHITATKGEASASLLLNVQVKVVSMQLRTSNDSLAVGLARETVFAAEKYAVIGADNIKTPNSVPIEIIGAPILGDDESESDYRIRMAVFYDAYKFEIAKGEEFATMGGEFGNVVTFIPSALKDNDRQVVTVKVSAKYPKYASTTAFTQSSVDLNVVYGVEVFNIDELRTASADQKAYTEADGNYVEKELVWEHYNTSNGRNDRYRVYNSSYSLHTYAIVFGTDIALDTDENGKPIKLNDWGGVYLYGSVYGNNHKFSAASGQLAKGASMFHVLWSGVTISNLNIRANDIDDSGTITNDETKGFAGQCVSIGNYNAYLSRLTNLRVEYSILENARRPYEFKNVDICLEGNIVRNTSNAAIYARSEMRNFVDEDGINTTFPMYSHIEMKNNVFSDCLATIGYFGYENFTYMPNVEATEADGVIWFDDYDNHDVSSGVGRFVRNDLKANDKYYRTHFLPAGINTTVTQKGFLDIYNWQNVNNANLIGDLGNSTLNNIVTAASATLLKNNDLFAPSIYFDAEEEQTYFHMGFLTAGINTKYGKFSEPSYFDAKLEDNRFAKPIRTSGMKSQCTDWVGKRAEEFLSNVELCYYGYTNRSDITPFSTYKINSLMILHLHGEA